MGVGGGRVVDRFVTGSCLWMRFSMRSLFFTAVVGVTYERVPALWSACRHGWCSAWRRTVSVIGASNAVQLVAHGEQRQSIAALRAVVICCAAKNVGVVSQNDNIYK